MIPQSFIEELKFQNEIESVVSSYVQLKKKGRISVGLCPFHSEKTPSFTVYPESQSFYCFGCGAGGDIIGFIRRIENLGYVESIKLLAERAGMRVPDEAADDAEAQLKTAILEMNREAAHYFHEQLTGPAGKTALAYLLQRGLSPQTITHFGLGYAPPGAYGLCDRLMGKGYRPVQMEAAALTRQGRSGKDYDVFRDRVMFPILDLRGNVIGFGGRKLSGDGPKYYNSPDTPVFKKTKNLFALNFAKKNKPEEFILCEGYMDVISMHQAGFTGAVASLGTSLTEDQCRLLASYTAEAILAYDADEAGRKASKRASGLLDEAGVRTRVLVIEGAKDPDEYIKNFGAARFAQLLKKSRGATEYELGRIKSKYDTDAPEGVIAAVKEATVLVAGLKNPLERDVWAAKIASDYNLPKEGVTAQVAALLKRQIRSQEKREAMQLRGLGLVSRDDAVPERVKNPAAAAAEERLLGTLYRHQELLPEYAAKVKQGDFVCGLYAKMFERMAQAAALRREIGASLFSDYGLAEQSAAERVFAYARERRYEPEEAADAYAGMLKGKEKKSDAEIKDMPDAEWEEFMRAKLAARKPDPQ
ncbi:MAG TPA: DNA primase [Oscillospiraceae bacterium]|nr:DNA primase [Oscillospiraceae bacterium]HNW04788.1 DNA primase [Oscillospiraceae bacterium]